MANIPEKIERIAAEGYEFRISDYLSQGLNIVQSDIGAFGGFALLYFLISIAAQIIPLASLLVLPPLMAGYFIYAHALATDTPRDFNKFFAGFQKFGDLFLAHLLPILIIVAFALPGIFLFLWGVTHGFRSSDSEFGDLFNSTDLTLLIIGFLLILVPAIYAGVSFSLAPMFVWFHGLSAWDAMQASRRIVDRQWVMFLIFYIVVGMLSGLGILLFCIGLLFTIPVGYVAMYAAFADITRLNEDPTPDDQLIDHFAPLN